MAEDGVNGAAGDRRWAIMVHGGAREIASDQAEANRRGCLAAVNAGQEILARGGSAVDACEAAVRVLEDDPTFNAGFGSDLNAEGVVEMDAALMDGATLDIGAVGCIEGARHPVSVARLLLREAPTLLVGEGARVFAARHGAELCPARDMIAPEPLWANRTSPADTVGCVALDEHGTLAVAMSTGGLCGMPAGRIGDTPLPGCGFYAQNGVGATALSGEGERIARALLAARVMQALEQGLDPESAAQQSLGFLDRIGGEAGAIVIDGQGRMGFTHNSPHFAVAWMAEGMDTAVAALRQDEGS
jgi:L-asparaginase / beta-aspartyl-peptidase